MQWHLYFQGEWVYISRSTMYTYKFLTYIRGSRAVYFTSRPQMGFDLTSIYNLYLYVCVFIQHLQCGSLAAGARITQSINYIYYLGLPTPATHCS